MKKSCPDIHRVNINHRASWQSVIRNAFLKDFKKNLPRSLFFAIFTFGVQPYQKYKKIKKATVQSIARRKLLLLSLFQELIERAREKYLYLDPRKALNAIFLEVQSEKVSSLEDALEFRAIYYPSEILLFITNPITDFRSIRLHRIEKKGDADYANIWYRLKKKAWVNQYRQIENINFCTKSLQKDLHLDFSEIHDRLNRTTVARKKVNNLTKFKELSRAFEEIVFAYHDFEEIEDTHPAFFHFFNTFRKMSKEEIETLQTYLQNHYLPKGLPFETRRQLIHLANQQESFSEILKAEKFPFCPLILNRYHWEFVLSMQDVSRVTVDLLDWAFGECPTNMNKELSFLQTISVGTTSLTHDDPLSFPTILEEIEKKQAPTKMTVNFAKELNREWPCFSLRDGEVVLFSSPKSDSLTIDQLLKIYVELNTFSQGNEELFVLLQEAVSQVGRQAFRTAIEESVVALLGTKSEYFFPIFLGSEIVIVKAAEDHIYLDYTFTQLITKKGAVHRPNEAQKNMVIRQPLIKIDGGWTSPEAEVTMAGKEDPA